MKKLLLIALLLASQEAVAWCGYLGLSGFYNNVPPNGTQIPLSHTQTYTNNTFSFNTTLPSDTHFYITDIIFQSKNVQPDLNGRNKSSYLVINGLITVAEHMGGQIHFQSPLLASPGTTFTGAFINQSQEEQNMIALIVGYAWDSEECRLRFKP